MVFLPTSQVRQGMRLARDLRMYDAAYGHSVLLRKGQEITQGAIVRIMSLGFSGLYIDDGTEDFNPDDMGLPDELRVECITAIKSLFVSFQGSLDREINKSFERLSATVDALIHEIKNNDDYLVNIVDLKMYDDYTYHHSLSVGVVAITVGMGLELDDVYLRHLGLSGILHDIGKLMVPASIVQKPGRLTEEEFELMKHHPSFGTKLLAHRDQLPVTVLDGIFSHHERVNGSGYPMGFKEEEIPFVGRVLAVADVYDALTSNRPYRAPSLPSEASEFIMGGSGTYFDSAVVKAFTRRIAPYPIGTCVRLSSGDVAVVIQNSESAPLRPSVRLMQSGEVLDLSDTRNIKIVISGLGYC